MDLSMLDFRDVDGLLAMLSFNVEATGRFLLRIRLFRAPKLVHSRMLW